MTRADRPIEDYALIGDLRGAALVASDGSIDWLCLGRFDAVPVLAALLDADRGGRCALTFDSAIVPAGRRYVAATNVLETRFASDGVDVLVTDFMPLRALPDAGDVGPDTVGFDRVVRIVRCTRGRADLAVHVGPTFDWARRDVAPVVASGVATFGGEELHVASSAALVVEHGAVVTRASLAAGDALVVVLARGAIASGDLAATASAQRDETERWWRDWSAQCTFRGEHADMALRSALALKLLTFAPSGAMVAAPTAGLPEVIGGVRNWDYRYVWTRDASFNVSAFLNLGFRREAAEFLRFLHDACDHGEAVRVLYTVDGPLPDVTRLAHLTGWRGSVPVTVGNDAGDQDQFEIFGELLAAIHLYVDRYGVDGLCPELVADLPAFVVRLVDATIDNWRSPDQGIWELKGAPRHVVHTKAMCWVALDRAIALAPQVGIAVPPHWPIERDRIRADCLEQGWNAARQSFTLEYGGTAVDMALLRLPLLQVIDATDPRITSTLDAMTADLSTGDLYHRYRMDDGLPGDEGAFLACSFWMAAVRLQRGDVDAGAGLVARMLARANDVGLYAEEMDVANGAHLGNFPQAFTHMAVIHEVIRLDEARARADGRADGARVSAGQGA